MGNFAKTAYAVIVQRTHSAPTAKSVSRSDVKLPNVQPTANAQAKSVRRSNVSIAAKAPNVTQDYSAKTAHVSNHNVWTTKDVQTEKCARVTSV